jgi:thiamine biosynthesis lipoprotein
VSGEERRTFACFGASVTVHVGGAGGEAAAAAESLLLDAHQRLSRFLPESELSRLNRDPRATVPASPLLLELAAAVRRAGFLSGGLVDATLIGQIEAAGYRESLAGEGEWRLSRFPAIVGPDPCPAAPSPERGWSLVSVDRRLGTVSRPPGLRIDSGGIAKGLLADLIAKDLRAHPSYSVDCCGDIRIGGAGGQPRTVLVDDPAGGEPLHSLAVRSGGVATSGIAKRSWVGADGAPAHHLLDPATGAPAFTGIVQATAQAPTAFLAEVYSKLALLSGPEQAPGRLPYGGVLVLDDGGAVIVEAQAARPRTAVAR